MQRRNTLQRQLVLAALRAMQTHATAEEVHREVSRNFGGISLATVYRNLNSLAAQGEVKKISVPAAADRFDFRVDEHYHLLCRECGAFRDSPLAYDKTLGALAANEGDFVIEGYDIVFTGLCKACARKQRHNVS